MINKVILIGNLGQDAEFKALSKSSLINLNIATSERYKDGDEWKDKTEWHKVQVWGKSEKFAQILTKGTAVYIEGKLSYSTSVEGDKKKYYTNIIGITVKPIAYGGSNVGASGRANEPQGDEPTDDDDLPF